MKWDMGGSAAVVGTMLALAAARPRPRRRRCRPCRKHAVRHGAAPRRRRDVDERPDHRSAEHRCGRPPRARRCALAHARPLQAGGDDQPRRPAPSSLPWGMATPACSPTMMRCSTPSCPPVRKPAKPCGACRWAMPMTPWRSPPSPSRKNIGDGSAGSAVAAVSCNALSTMCPGRIRHRRRGLVGQGQRRGAEAARIAWGVRLLDQLVKSKYEA